MIVRTIIKAKFFALVSILIVIAGCAGVNVYPQKHNSNAVQQFRTAQVVWIDNPHFKIVINKTAHGVKPIIDDSDKAEAKQSIEQLIFLYQKSGVEKIKERLSQKGVVEGDDVILELTPRVATVHINGRRGLGVLATIKQKGSTQVVWSVIIDSYGAHSIKDDVFIDNFISALVICWYSYSFICSCSV